MNSPAPVLLSALLLTVVSAPVAAQAATDLIWYPFIRGSGTTVQNLYLGSNNPVPKTGTFISTNTGGPWEKSGRIGSCMRGKDSKSTATYNYVDTGWKGGMKGSMTISWFMKLRTDLGFLSNNLPNIGYFITGYGSFRIFTGGVANKGLVIRSWGGTPSDIYLGGGFVIPHTGYDLHAAAKKDWVHIALVIDSVAGEATYYVDGGRRQTTTITGAVNLPLSTANNFRVGAHSGTGTAFNYDIDEFRLVNRVATQTEIQNWAQARLRVDKTDLSMSNADSQKFTLTAGIANRIKFYWLLGSLSGTYPGFQYGPLTIPLKLDAYSDVTLSLPNIPALAKFRGLLDANGNGTASLNLPKGYKDPRAIGLYLYHAYVVYDGNSNFFMVSNPTRARLVK